MANPKAHCAGSGRERKAAIPARRILLSCLSSILFLLPAAQVSAKTETPGAQLAFGVEMAKRGLWSEALFRFSRAERLDPDNPKILNNLAVAYEATGQFDEALAQYQKALRLRPNDRELRRNYSRFIEFYQSFKPEAENAAEGEEGPGEAGRAGGD